jgi:hypothetical protein
MTHLSSTTSLLSGSISGPLCKHNCKCSKINEMKVNYAFNNIVLTFFKTTIVAFLDISSLKNKNRIWKWQIWLKYFRSLFRLHSGPDIDPDNRDVVDDKWVIDGLSGFVAKHFPNLVPEPSIKETCIYTVSNEHIHFNFNYSYCVISSLKNKNRIWKWQIWLKYFRSLFRK